MHANLRFKVGERGDPAAKRCRLWCGKTPGREAFSVRIASRATGVAAIIRGMDSENDSTPAIKATSQYENHASPFESLGGEIQVGGLFTVR